MSNIHSLNTDDDKPPRRGGGHSGSESDDEGDDNREGFFVGGSDHSGQEVLGANRGDAQSRLFDAIQRAGAEQLTPEQIEAMERQRAAGGGSTSTGGGFRLGGHGIPTAQLGGPSSAAQSRPVPPGQRPTQLVRMYLWQNGFSIDDGPLRSFEDPQNRAFMQALMQKRIPPELVLKYPGQEVDLRMERKMEDYVPPKPKPFTGKGHRLGSITPELVSGSSSNNAEVVDLEPSSPLKKPEESTVQKAQDEVGVDDSQPTTRIQVRFPDVQQPVVGRFNETHTVDQVRTFIVGVQPTLAFRPFQMMTIYPRKLIEDEQQTLKEAGLLNAAVTIKFEE